mmetsp:Transcript_12865/g.18800  ORF Transcript_12865/g.18800 Transcript_12865/m.18800 type:complete len:117 (+) Transcript_12865:760-1110(+)
MDSELLEWLSYQEVQNLDSEDLMQSLEDMLQTTEVKNLEQIMQNQDQTDLIIQKIEDSDSHLEELEERLEEYIQKIKKLREKTLPLEQSNSALATEQQNVSNLVNALTQALNQHSA